MTPSRQLAAILFTDIVGYTAMMQEDESAAIAVVRNYTMVLRQVVEQHKGTIVNDYGDGNLCTFSSVTEAVRCAIELQRKLQPEPKVPLRVGLHVGEIFFEDGKVLGDGVNVASRIQSLGVANSILFSSEIHSKISNQSEFKAVSLGSFHFKNVSVPMEVLALTNEGLVLPRRVDMEGKLKVKSIVLKKWIASAALILVAITSVFLSWEYLNPPTPESIKKSVAVLAFEDLSPNKDHEWFSDGLSEEIINSLANLKDLQVTARTSAFYFKGKSIPLNEIAAKLNVEYVVEGSVRRVDDQFRVVVQLIDAANGFHVLSQTYDRPAKDLLQIQSDIAKDISEKLIYHLTPGQYASMNEDRTKNSEAYEFYLRAKKQHSNFQMDHSENRDKAFYSAENLFLKAIDLDQDYASAYGALANLYDSRGNVTDRLRLWRLRDSLARKAFRINPHSVDGLVACYLIYAKPNASPVLPDSAFWYLKKAHLDNPNDSEVLRLLGLFCSRSVLPVEGVRFTTRSLGLDPLNFFARQQLANYYFCLGQLDQAEIELAKLVEMDSMRIPVRHLLGMVYALKTNLSRANSELSFCEKYFPGSNVDLRDLILAASSDKTSTTQSKDILVLSTLGLRNEVYQQLDSCVGLKWNATSRGPLFSALALENNRAFDFMRNDTRFKAILERARIDQIEKQKKFRLD